MCFGYHACRTVLSYVDVTESFRLPLFNRHCDTCRCVASFLLLISHKLHDVT